MVGNDLCRLNGVLLTAGTFLVLIQMRRDKYIELHALKKKNKATGRKTNMKNISSFFTRKT
jgi:hypothetical protein